MISPDALVSMADRLDTLERENRALRKENKSLRFMQALTEGFAENFLRELRALRAQQDDETRAGSEAESVEARTPRAGKVAVPSTPSPR